MAWVRSPTKRRRCSSSIDRARTSSGSSAGPNSRRLRRTTSAIANASPASVLPGPWRWPLAVGAPGRHLQNLKPGGSERTHEPAAIAARRLDTDHGLLRVVLAQPTLQTAIARRTVGDGQRGDLAAAFIDQRSSVGMLVDVDPDEHLGWPPGSELESRPGRRATLLCRCNPSARDLLSSQLRRPARNPTVDESNAGQSNLG